MSCDCNESGSIFTEQKTEDKSPLGIICSAVEKCINDRLNVINPKCVASVANWTAMSIAQKFQALIDTTCLAVPPGINPITTNLSLESPVNSASGSFTASTFENAILLSAELTQTVGPFVIPTSSLSTTFNNVSPGIYNVNWLIAPAWGSPSFVGNYTFKLTIRDSNNQTAVGTINIAYTSVVTYNTILSFVGNTYIFLEGVSAQVGALSTVMKLEFNKVSNPIGLYNSMTILVNAIPVMAISYRSEYTGAAFRYTHTDGRQFNGIFGNDINFS